MIEYDELYYQRYFAENFNEKLLPGLGIEDCLNWSASCFTGQNWLDVGAGTSTYFWAAAAPQDIRSICIADFSRIPLAISSELARSRRWPTAYREALAYLGRPVDHLDDIAGVPVKIETFDAFASWPDLPRFETVTAFGLLGLATTDHQMNALVASARRAMPEGGIFFGATWIFSERYAERLGGRVQKIESIEPALGEHFADVEVREIAISDDDYPSILLFRAS
jgi:hypothetical protein